MLMKRYLTKVAASLVVFGLGTTTSYADNGYTNVYNPYFGLGGWTFKIGFPYQKFSNNGTNFASNTKNDFNIDTSYNWGYNLGIGYHFPVSGTDVNLDYTNINSSDTHRIWRNDLLLEGGGLTGPFGWGSGKIEFDYESLDLTAGHAFVVNPSFAINYYGGLSYLHLTKDMTIEGRNVFNRAVIEGGTSYKGFGPTFGIGGSCYPFAMAPQFSVIGDVKASFYYGTLDSYDRLFDHNIDFSHTFVTHLPDEKVVVPGVNAKLGLNYVFPVQGMRINTQLGYSLSDYFSVTKDSSYSASNSDISFQGPYFTAAITF